MSTSIPNEYAQNTEGMVIMNSISFSNLEDWNADPAKVTCKTTIGNEYNGEVKQYDKDTDLKTMSALGDTTKELSRENSVFAKADDPSKYTTYSDDTQSYANCTIEMTVTEENRESLAGIFDYVYEIEYGVKLLESATDETGIDITDSMFEAYLPSTTYDDSFDDVTEEA
jgi:hypothetical protein